jgi:hypothetical protein
MRLASCRSGGGRPRAGGHPVGSVWERTASRSATRRAPRCPVGDDAAERPHEPVEGAARPRPRGTGRARAPQRAPDRRASRLAPPDRNGADERAKHLERNLHDGAQQQLVALGVQLGLASRIAARESPEMAETLEGLRAQATDALENLRDLARGIYPPLLADQGLVVALEAQARKAALPVEVEGGGIGRYPPEVEAAIYFCCLEALQNVAKYANASSARLRLADQDGTVSFTVTDNGTGFDPARTPLGTGLQGMKDRLEALGGPSRSTRYPAPELRLVVRSPREMRSRCRRWRRDRLGRRGRDEVRRRPRGRRRRSEHAAPIGRFLRPSTWSCLSRGSPSPSPRTSTSSRWRLSGSRRGSQTRMGWLAQISLVRSAREACCIRTTGRRCAGRHTISPLRPTPPILR